MTGARAGRRRGLSVFLGVTLLALSGLAGLGLRGVGTYRRALSELERNSELSRQLIESQHATLEVVILWEARRLGASSPAMAEGDRIEARADSLRQLLLGSPALTTEMQRDVEAISTYLDRTEVRLSAARALHDVGRAEDAVGEAGAAPSTVDSLLTVSEGLNTQLARRSLLASRSLDDAHRTLRMLFSALVALGLAAVGAWALTPGGLRRIRDSDGVPERQA